MTGEESSFITSTSKKEGKHEQVKGAFMGDLHRRNVTVVRQERKQRSHAGGKHDPALLWGCILTQYCRACLISLLSTEGKSWCGQENTDLDPGKSTSLDTARDKS